MFTAIDSVFEQTLFVSRTERKARDGSRSVRLLEPRYRAVADRIIDGEM
jgi:hypothetical protein